MSDPKQVKVDNWGIYFLQRLKHFFNRTDYCDLTLQFQDNAQLKVHRLVLSACTEYFELLERTCEMYEDCLVMPDDLQADVVVPIVNFMYTGQLEFKMDILERLHATSEIMNMPVLTKLLDSHRPKNRVNNSYSSKRQFKQQNFQAPSPSIEIVSKTPAAPKRSFAKAFEKSTIVYKDKKYCQPMRPATTINVTNGGVVYKAPSPIPFGAFGNIKQPKFVAGDPRPTRYELPEELDTDNIFENSFCNISYTSQPLMVHPETTKQYAKRPRQDKGQASTSKNSRSSILDIVECKKFEREPEESFYEEPESAMVSDESQMFKPAFLNTVNIKTESAKDPNKLFDQLLDQNEEHSAKVTIETTKNNKAGANLDHARIISDVLKKYPHLVKSNKNIKLKIFNNPASSTKGANKKQKASPQPVVDRSQYVKADIADYTFETDVLDSKQAARLIALGAANIEGPWICLICGTPGKALHFTSYYKFRRHLVEVHNEKPVLNICEYCGQRMSKRNHLLHHMYTKHDVEPPPTYHFPKCLQCNYIALTEALLVKHKLSHTENKSFRCNVCPASFNSSNLLLTHIQNTGHKYIADRKQSHQCIYCLRVFVRENNLYAHLKTHHKTDAVRDGIIDESDDETKEDIVKVVKHEPASNEYEDNHMEYHIQQKPDGNIQLVKKKQTETPTLSKQKILNSGLTFKASKAPPKSKPSKTFLKIQAEQNQDETPTFNENEEIVMIDNNEYVMSGNRLILRNPRKQHSEEYILSDIIEHDKQQENSQSLAPSTSMDYATILNSNENIQQASIILKDTGNLSEPIPIYVSNEEEYKALMSSTNHNIIFDSNDANKTLTVLTTPDAATIDNTHINLDNTQNNDMMIIHDDYPMNVSQAVATENSNIVVVYSHQMSNPNKEYQLLTTQALGPQYAQTSAILTQNYETVSTSSPVMSAHILNSPIATWQGDIHQNIDNQQSESSAVLQSIVHAEEVQTTNSPKPIIDISYLPQVQLTSEPINLNENINSGPPETELIQNTQNVSMELDTSLNDSEKEKIEDFEPIESVPVNVQDSQEEVTETDILKQSESQETEQVPDSENFLEVEQQPVMDIQSTDTNENNINLEIPSSNINETIDMDIQRSDTNENISVDIQSCDTIEITQTNMNDPITETVDQASAEPVCTENRVFAPDVVQQIQTLTSEWSEDNVETPPQDTIVETEIQKCTDPEINSEEVEESVENIKQELKKQMLESNAPEDNLDSLAKPDLPEPDKDESKTNKSIDPQVKITTLLNDWDDIDDFQENNEVDESVSTEPITENGPSHIQNPETNNVIPVTDQELVKDNISSESADDIENPPSVPDDEVIENTPTNPETNEPLPENEIVAKQDNIKSLVSDWDDDEEDNKE